MVRVRKEGRTPQAKYTLRDGAHWKVSEETQKLLKEAREERMKRMVEKHAPSKQDNVK